MWKVERVPRVDSRWCLSLGLSISL